MRLVNERLFSSVVFAVRYPSVSFLLFPPPLSSNRVTLFHHVFSPVSNPSPSHWSTAVRPTLDLSFARILISSNTLFSRFLFPFSPFLAGSSIRYPLATGLLCLAKFPRFPIFRADTSTTSNLLLRGLLSLNTYISEEYSLQPPSRWCALSLRTFGRILCRVRFDSPWHFTLNFNLFIAIIAELFV